MADEELREASCLGNIDAVKKLLKAGVDVNSQNSVNGWTALHWACKRNHFNITDCLLKHGADSSIQTHDGTFPSTLAIDERILSLLPPPIPPTCSAAVTDNISHSTSTSSSLPILPNYLQYPVFPYQNSNSSSVSMNSVSLSNPPSPRPTTAEKGQVCLVKVRIADSEEKDFVEVEMENMTFNNLLKCSCEELEVSTEDVVKIRKLPNILVRKDKDTHRLSSNDYLELVLKTCM